jgi:hypothetical protein
MTLPRALVAAVFAALAAVPASALAGTGMAPLRLSRLAQPAPPFRDAVLRGSPDRFAKTGKDPEGMYTTKDGIVVHVVFPGLTAPDAVAGQSTADFLGALLHGPELATVTIELGSFAAVQDACGIVALACYFPGRRELFVPTSLPPGNDVPLEQILAHEYGHHVAESRLNPPWPAVDWGPKRWATYMQVCSQAFGGNMFPGDEGAGYELNPGEGWAEAFRLANSLRIGTWPDIGWPIVDNVFRPDTTALGLVAQDVLTPWAATPARQLSGVLRRGQVRRVRIATPLDGTATATATGPAGIRVAFANGRGSRRSANGRRASTTVCGVRTTTVTVRAKRAGRFALAYTTP